MIYEQPGAAETLSQGDILDGCPILFWENPGPGTPPPIESASTSVRVVVLTQACDLAQVKATRVLVAVVHQVQHLVERGVLQSKVIRDQIRTHRVYGWYFLPAGAVVEESIVDLRDLHTVPRALLDRLLLDRGFYSIEVIRYLQQARVPFLMPADHLSPYPTKLAF